MINETPENRAKRLSMRSWRRGTKEMDLILGPFSDDLLGTLDESEILLYETLLGENDQDLYKWITGQPGEPVEISGMLDRIRAYISKREKAGN